MLRLDGKEALSVHGFAITVVNTTTGEPLSPTSGIPNHHITAEHVAEAAQAGRGRWKIANDNTNGLKTNGDPVEHHFGHGKQSLSAVRLSLNLRALLCHTVLEWSDAKYALLRRVLARRQTCVDASRAFTRSLVFDSWDHLRDCMLRSLELQSSLDTSGEPKLELLGRCALSLGPKRLRHHPGSAL